MSYRTNAAAPRLGMGTVEPWSVMAAHTLDPAEVYVLRLPCTGLPLREASDLLLFARAGGQGQNLDLDVRAVGAAGDGSAWSIDIVFTSATWHVPPPLVADSAKSMAEQVAADEQLRASFPSLRIDADAAAFGELVGPKDAIDTWLSQPRLWEASLSGPKKRGGPTATFAKPVDLSLFKGQADDGRLATPWRVTSPPIGPHDRGDESSSVGWYILGGVAAVGLGLVIWSRSKTR